MTTARTKRLHTVFRRLFILLVIVNSAALVVAVNSSSGWSNKLMSLAVIAGVGAALMFVGFMTTKT